MDLNCVLYCYCFFFISLSGKKERKKRLYFNSQSQYDKEAIKILMNYQILEMKM